MEKTLKNLSDVSFFFFLVFGAMHISASLLVAQGVIERVDWLIFSSLDLPFLFAGLLYMTSKLSLGLGNIIGDSKIPLILLSILSVVAFGFALYFNFILPDASLV